MKFINEIKRAVRKTIVFVYSCLPNISAMTPPTKEELDAWKARRNPDILWADEVGYATSDSAGD